MQHHPKEQTMTDVKFDGAMAPLVDALIDGLTKDPIGIGVYQKGAAAVVEALGIPAQMVANAQFRADLAALVGRHTLPPIRHDEPEAVTTPNVEAPFSPSQVDGLRSLGVKIA
jgi:hypothetical protein